MQNDNFRAMLTIVTEYISLLIFNQIGPSNSFVQVVR